MIISLTRHSLDMGGASVNARHATRSPPPDRRMMLTQIVPPVWELRCDRYPICKHSVRDDSEYGARIRADRAGWQLRPRRGKGKYTAPDFCPDHKEK